LTSRYNINDRWLFKKAGVVLARAPKGDSEMKKLFSPILFAMILAVAVLTGATSANAQGRWAKLAPFPEPAEELLGASA
jgi:hypothetical protein